MLYLGDHGHRTLIAACNPMLCPNWDFRSEEWVTDRDGEGNGDGDGDGAFAVAVAVYTSGSLAVIALDEAGKLVGAPMITNHTGRSACTTPPASTRQTSPHP